MRGVIQFYEIKDLSMLDADKLFASFTKPKYGDLKLSDMFLGNLSDLDIYSWDSSNSFGYGVYIVYDDQEPIYVGKAKKHFLHRFLSHVHYDPRPEWGFNRMLKGINVRYFNGDPIMYSREDHEAALSKLKEFSVLRINGLNNGITVTNCQRLEDVVNWGLHALYGTLINGNKKLSPTQLQTTIKTLMRL